jgi:hypothetical protein
MLVEWEESHDRSFGFVGRCRHREEPSDALEDSETADFPHRKARSTHHFVAPADSVRMLMTQRVRAFESML